MSSHFAAYKSIQVRFYWNYKKADQVKKADMYGEEPHHKFITK